MARGRQRCNRCAGTKKGPSLHVIYRACQDSAIRAAPAASFVNLTNGLLDFRPYRNLVSPSLLSVLIGAGTFSFGPPHRHVFLAAVTHDAGRESDVGFEHEGGRPCETCGL